jgi:precorrin-6A synthase
MVGPGRCDTLSGMRQIIVIGIGAGDPEQVTVQAVNALGRADVFFVLDKGAVKHELTDLRQEILDRYVRDRDYRIVWGGDPERDRTAAAYADAVDDWRRRRADVCARLIEDELGLNQVGGSVQITTGRRLAAGWPDDVDDVVVMLDAHTVFAGLAEPDAEIFWGAYLGTPDEILVSGPVPEVADRIVALRKEARRRKGWLMDTYLLRRRSRRGFDA